MLSDSLKYDFPHGNKDPFEKGDENGNYFVYANAHSNLGNNLDEFNLDVLGRNIDMGYKTIIVCKRLILISKGEVIQKWNENIDIKSDSIKIQSSRKYLVTTNKSYDVYVKGWNSNHKTTTIYNSNIECELPWSVSWDKIYDCVKIGIENSIKMKCEVLISSIIQSHSWH